MNDEEVAELEALELGVFALRFPMFGFTFCLVIANAAVFVVQFFWMFGPDFCVPFIFAVPAVFLCLPTALVMMGREGPGYLLWTVHTLTLFWCVLVGLGLWIAVLIS